MVLRAVQTMYKDAVCILDADKECSDEFNMNSPKLRTQSSPVHHRPTGYQNIVSDWTSTASPIS